MEFLLQKKREREREGEKEREREKEKSENRPLLFKNTNISTFFQ